MKEYQSLSHTRWDCKYHVVFIPKRRKKRVFGALRRHLGEMFHELAAHKESKIVEGHLIFGEPALRALFDLRLFLDVPPDERVLRRMLRDAVERGGDLAWAIGWYRRDVLPNYRLYTEPTRQFADLVLPWTEANEAVIDLVAAGVRARLLG